MLRLITNMENSSEMMENFEVDTTTLPYAASYVNEDPLKLQHCEIVGGLWRYLMQYAPPMMACFGKVGEIILERRERGKKV